jgi:para-nitrobenzyl esterase
MVWLHGGGFAVGTPTRAREEPSLLSARGDVVVVAPNHRLGAFGYLYLEADGRPLVTPNLGMLDIVTALEWVQENVEDFGGDPSNVTVFGESGGAMKTATLLSLPRAKGLFRRGICQAGVFAAGFRFGPLTREAAHQASRDLMRRLGVEKDLAALTTLPMADVVAAQESADGELMAWRPVIDGEVLPVDPAYALLEGRDFQVPMIVGWAAHEADFIFHGAPFTIEELERQLGLRGRRLYEAYAAERPGAKPEEVVEAVLSDWIFGMPSIAFAEARAKAGHQTYVYQMTWGRADDSSARATHGAENPFVFDRLGTTGYSREALDALPLAKIMQQAWIAFARDGRPAAEGAPPWPPYTAPDRSVMIFDRSCRLDFDPRRRERTIWADKGN